MLDRRIDLSLSSPVKPRKLVPLLWGTLAAALTALPSKAAEKIELVYTPLVLSVPVRSIETFAKEGTIDPSLRTYLGRVSPEERAAFREALVQRANINPVLLSRFFNSEMGADMLSRLGRALTIEGGSNGKYAIRGALVSAAFDEDGLTLLNVLKKFPTNMQIQGELILGLAEEVERLVAAAELFTAKMRQWTLEEARTLQPPVNYANLPDLRQRGGFDFTREVWHLTDESRNRRLYVEVYVPKTFRAGKTPVVVFSHGLASRPEDYSGILEHLASYGFLVAAPQHPGSDLQYLQEMFAGYHRNIFDREEFINRPRDISFALDELERRNASRFQNRLDLTNVGMAGHSFGGYTALAIAGAEIDFQNLQQDCQRMYVGLNIAILLQCRALALPRRDYRFRDGRVTAVFAGNPVNRAIFGREGLGKITIPVILGAGSYDPAANPIFEQAASFTWLNTPNKYLALVEGQAHVNFNELDAGLRQTIDSVEGLTLPSPDLLGSYSSAIGLAFFEVYTARNERFRPFLHPAHAEYLSRDERFKLDLIGTASSDELARAIERFQRGR